MNLRGINSPLMSLKHIRMINSASKCLTITLKLNKFSKPENKFKKKLKLRGIPPFNHLRGGKPCLEDYNI
jgi:hypothetical protein